MRPPSQNNITLKFGATSDPYTKDFPHMGTDYSYLPDDTIYAPADGVVTLVPNNGKDGNGVYMNVGNYFVGMLHTSKYLVKNGATVQAGQPIALMGDTGYAFGKHLHFCVRLGNTFVDPMKLIEEDDMYKGHSAQFWHGRYQKVLKEKSTLKLILDKVKSVVGK